MHAAHAYAKQIRNKYLEIKRKFRKSKSPIIKAEMKAKGKELKQCRKSKICVERNLHNKLRGLKSNNSKEYWNVLYSANKSTEKLGTFFFTDAF